MACLKTIYKTIYSFTLAAVCACALAPQALAVRSGRLAQDPAFAAVVGIDSCTAVVVHPRALLTAGHCARHLREGQETVFPSSRSQRVSVTVKKITVHPKYEAEPDRHGKLKINDDIAVVVLREALDRDVPPIAIARMKPGSSWESQSFAAVGMGMYRKGFHAYLGDSMNSAKRWASYEVVQHKASVFFLKSKASGVGICDGDSGGGLLVKTPTGYALAGVLTAVTDYCGKDGELAYAEIASEQLAWIESVLRPEGIALSEFVL